MTIRERIEYAEKIALSPNAVLSCQSKGRAVAEEECQVRTAFMRDRDRIIHCKTFRRLKQKTQMFLLPEGDHYRTRLTHTLEVAQIARTIARALFLNEDLVEAIALGHDLGHTPFGHGGERALDQVMPQGFRHNEQSLRAVEKLEKGGRGLNLTVEVRDGILCHTGKKKADTLCGRIVHYADRIAYINHDIDDALRADVLKIQDIPKEITDVLGTKYGKRVDRLVKSIITHSINKDYIGMEGEVEQAMLSLRSFLFENVYSNPAAKGEEYKGVDIVKQLYHYFMENCSKLPDDYKIQLDLDQRENVVADYIAGMTDKYAIAKFSDVFIPKVWSKID